MSYAISEISELIPPSLRDYLRRVADTVREYKVEVHRHAAKAQKLNQLRGTLEQLSGSQTGERVPDAAIDEKEIAEEGLAGAELYY